MKSLRLIVLLLLFSVAIPAAHAAEPSQWINPPLGADDLNGMWAAPYNDETPFNEEVFAVGDNGTILHYDGRMWSRMDSGTTAHLGWIFGTDKANLYIVGYEKNGTTNMYDLSMLKYDDADLIEPWKQLTQPFSSESHLPPSDACCLWDARSPDYLRFHISGTRYLIHFWDDEEWGFDGHIASEMPGHAYAVAVWSSSLYNVFLADNTGTIWWTNNFGWRPTMKPVEGSYQIEHIKGLVDSENKPLAVFFVFHDNDSGKRSIYRYFNATGAWDKYHELESDQAVADLSVLDTKTVRVLYSGGSCPLVQYTEDANGDINSTCLGSKTINTGRINAFTFSSLNNLYIAGDHGSLCKRVNNELALISGVTLNDLTDIWGTGPESVYAVGYKKTLLHYDGSHWYTIDYNDVGDAPDRFNTVWGYLDPAAKRDHLFLTWDDRIFEYTNDAWQKTFQGSEAQSVRHVHGSSKGSSIIAVGLNIAMERVGDAWVDFSEEIKNIAGLGPDDDLRLDNVWVAENGDVFVGDNAGGCYHRDYAEPEKKWKAMDDTPPTPIKILWGLNANSVYAVTTDHELYHYGYGSWKKLGPKTETELWPEVINGIWGSSDTDLYICDRSAIYRFDGTECHVFDDKINGLAFEIWGASENDIYAVGTFGMIKHYGPLFKIGFGSSRGGSIEPDGMQFKAPQAGACEPVEAIPFDGYSFSMWSDGNTENPRVVDDVKEDMTLIALFKPHEYELTFTAQGAGTVDEQHEVVYVVPHDGRTRQPVVADPLPGNHFRQWMENGAPVESDGNSLSVRDVTGPRHFTAVFEPDAHAVTFIAAPDQGGTIEGQTSQRVDHGGAGSMVTAVAAEGWYFSGWSDGIAAETRTATNVVRDMALTAFFVENPDDEDSHNVIFRSGGNGLVNDSASLTWPVKHGGNIESPVTANPAEGYRFSHWLHKDQKIVEQTVQPGNVTENLTYTAIFIPQSPDDTYLVTVEATAGGLVNGKTHLSFTLDDVSSTTVAARPNTGFRFVHWRQDGSIVNTADGILFIDKKNIRADTRFVAVFEPNVFKVTFDVQGSGTLQGKTQQEVEYGGNCEKVTAVADEGHHFVRWMENNQTVPSDNGVLVVTNVTRPMTLTALFQNDNEPIVHKVIFRAGQNGTVRNKNGAVNELTYEVRHGEDVTEAVSAQPDAGYVFRHWLHGDALITTATLEITNVTEDLVYEAVFVPDDGHDRHKVTIRVVPEGSGTVDGETAVTLTMTDMDTKTVTAEPADGYTFKAWTENGKTLQTETVLELKNITGDRDITAEFQTKNNPHGGGGGGGGGCFISNLLF